MNTLPILWKWVLAVCGLIAAVGGAATVLSRLGRPRRDMEIKMDKLEAKLAALEQHHNTDQQANNSRFQSDLGEIKRLDESNRQLCKCMLALMDHEITGNSIDKLKKTRDDLNMFLIDNK